MDIAAGFSRPGTSRVKKCYFYLKGACRYGEECRFAHENATNNVKTYKPQTKGASTSRFKYKKRNRQSKFQDKSAEEALELVRKSQSSKMLCGICFETVLEKDNVKDQVFGILPNCNHCYCFNCIKTWRQSREFEFSVAKSCPECRVASNFVYVSRFWYDSKEEKETFILNEKARMQKVNCRYFRRGHGRCPFGNTCLYLHALPDGTRLDVGPPKPPRPNRRVSSNADLFSWMDDERVITTPLPWAEFSFGDEGIYSDLNVVFIRGTDVYESDYDAVEYSESEFSYDTDDEQDTDDYPYDED